ncbi:DUF4276 family protein [Pseudanabaena mucicola]|uniref:DUF4276 family protein n=1 Tax=Pseudanabaena mucicola FACHB-723 TaxID=2692860 RepID=A0ABR7ZXI6_9CYAN|nr:DUF4276 family protein [Pseudanabaena mucicola]MBD2188500.1 DUF4276 family protein [Pseudanabaena mucicola FACHB-723]
MKRLAIFVEGQTEKIFVRKLLEEIAGKSNIAIAEQDMQGKQNSRFTVLTMSDPVTAQTKYYVLICNSGSDNSVVSDIRDQYASLVSSGYSKIIGLRDVYPIPIADKGILEGSLRTVLPRGSVSSHIVLAIMEVEAWFLAEWKHFLKIDVNLTTSLIQSNLGFNPEVDNMENRNHPAEDLHQAYQLVGKSYRKKENQVNRVVSNLDYEFLYLQLAGIIPSLGKFISYIDDFMML